MSKKELIISTARALFYKFGLKKVSIEDIVNESEISKATLYRYFTNKSDIAIAILEESFTEDIKNIEQVLANYSEFSDIIKKIVELHEEKFSEKCEEFYTDALKYYPDILDVMEKHRVKMLEITVEFLSDNQRKGNIRPNLDVNLIAMTITSISESIVRGNIDTSLLGRKEYFRQVIDIFFYGIINR